MTKSEIFSKLYNTASISWARSLLGSKSEEVIPPAKISRDLRRVEQAFLASKYIEVKDPSKTPLWFFKQLFCGADATFIDARHDSASTVSISGYQILQNAKHRTILTPEELNADFEEKSLCYEKYLKLAKLLIEYTDPECSEENKSRYRQELVKLVGDKKADKILEANESGNFLSYENIGNLFAQVLDKEGRLFISPTTYRYLNLRAYGGSMETTLSKKEAKQFLESFTGDLVKAGFNKPLLESLIKVFGKDKSIDILIDNVFKDRIRVNYATGNSDIGSLIDYTNPKNLPKIFDFIYEQLQSSLSHQSGISKLFKSSPRPAFIDNGLDTKKSYNLGSNSSTEATIEYFPNEVTNSSEISSDNNTKASAEIKPSNNPHTVVINSVGKGLNELIINPGSYRSTNEDVNRLVQYWIDKRVISSNDGQQVIIARSVAEALLIIKDRYDSYISGMNNELPLVSIGDLQRIQHSVSDRMNKHEKIVNLATTFYGLVTAIANGGNVLEFVKELKDMKSVIQNYSFRETEGFDYNVALIVQNTIEDFNGDIEKLDSENFLRTFSKDTKQAFTTILFNNIVDHIIRNNPALNAEVKKKFAPIIDPFLVGKLERRTFFWRAAAGITAATAVIGTPIGIYQAGLPGFAKRESFTLTELFDAEDQLGNDIEEQKLKLFSQVMKSVNPKLKDTMFDLRDAIIIPVPVSVQGNDYKHHETGAKVTFYRDSTSFVEDLGIKVNVNLKGPKMKGDDLRKAFFDVRSEYTSRLKMNAPELITPIIIQDVEGKPKLVLVVDTFMLERMIKSPRDFDLSEKAALGLSFLPPSTKISYDRFLHSKNKSSDNQSRLVLTRDDYDGCYNDPIVKRLSNRIQEISHALYESKQAK
jgi:hypothetical protein